MLAVIGLITCGVDAAKQPVPLPRIAVRSGRFVNTETGKVFNPRGFNYIRLRMAEKGGHRYLWHDTLNAASYSPERSERMFADVSARGFNLVRIFLDHEAGPGFVEHAGADRLSPGYLRSFLDFLSRARAHRVYVIPCFCYLPDRVSYRAGAAPEHVGGGNQQYLHPGYVRSRARYMADVCAAIKEHDPGLLSTVLAYEIENESHFMATEPPFSLSSGTIRWGGKSYDAASDDDLQRLADDGIIRAINTALTELRKVDRLAMVGASAFTFRAVGRSGPAKFKTDKTQDPRFPARPLAMARSRAAYVDVHFYPVSEGTLDADYKSIEWPELKAACVKAGKPMIVGEIGAFKFAYPDISTAAEAMASTLRRLQKDGWAGFLYWTYDNVEQAESLWHALDGQGEIIKALERAAL